MPKKPKPKIFKGSGPVLKTVQDAVTAESETWMRSREGQRVGEWSRTQAIDYSEKTGLYTFTVTISYVYK